MLVAIGVGRLTPGIGKRTLRKVKEIGRTEREWPLVRCEFVLAGEGGVAAKELRSAT